MQLLRSEVDAISPAADRRTDEIPQGIGCLISGINEGPFGRSSFQPRGMNGSGMPALPH